MPAAGSSSIPMGPSARTRSQRRCPESSVPFTACLKRSGRCSGQVGAVVLCMVPVGLQRCVVSLTRPRASRPSCSLRWLSRRPVGWSHHLPQPWQVREAHSWPVFLRQSLSRALLHVLSQEELSQLEKSLCVAESEAPGHTAAPEPRAEVAPDACPPAPHACSLHPPAAGLPHCTLACRGRTPAGDTAAHGAVRGAEQGELVTTGSERFSNRLLPGRIRDPAAACAGSVWPDPWTPAKPACRVVPGPACSTSRDTWLQMPSAMPEGAGRSGSLGPPLDRLWQSQVCSANHGQLALMASGPQEPTLPTRGVGACAHMQKGLAPPALASIGANSRPRGQQPGSAQGRALPAAGLSTREAALRSHYSSPAEMVHTLFICISGVADQLQTNFASDLRSILKTVFRVVTSQPEAPAVVDPSQDDEAGDDPPLADCALCSSHRQGPGTRPGDGIARLPEWVLDSTCSQCTACHAPFTMLRRRHHCRNCGKIFCTCCSQHTAPLPHYGQPKSVRVCTHCYTTHLPASPRTLSRS
uniref:FYVE-type domain-containing protein n=1 Tax=Pelusios castaneus TaxID=367368 RepID=A0A8C8SLW1_9SAUR